MKQHESKYIPAFSFKILIPLYDTFFKATMREEFFKDRLSKKQIFNLETRCLFGLWYRHSDHNGQKAHPDSEVIGTDGIRKF
jgi:hypothetical protein